MNRFQNLTPDLPSQVVAIFLNDVYHTWDQLKFHIQYQKIPVNGFGGLLQEEKVNIKNHCYFILSTYCNYCWTAAWAANACQTIVRYVGLYLVSFGSPLHL